MAAVAVPETMKAVRLSKILPGFTDQDIAECMTIETVPVPKPKAGDVLIRVSCPALQIRCTFYSSSHDVTILLELHPSIESIALTSVSICYNLIVID
jgi:hypothetical protein